MSMMTTLSSLLRLRLGNIKRFTQQSFFNHPQYATVIIHPDRTFANIANKSNGTGKLSSVCISFVQKALPNEMTFPLLLPHIK